MTTPGLRFGRYEVGERLGKGSFGIVHLAKDVELGRELAIKFLKPEYLTRTQIVQRFLQEARAAAKIGHPGIVTVFECGLVAKPGQRIDGTAFIAMERLAGATLSDRMHEAGKLPAATAIALGRQIASALAAAHAANIVHRDLKPDNVYLIPDPAVVGGERVKIVDFGVAKLVEPSGVETHSQMILGTPRYMAPEQARSSAHVDHRADIYAFGCILYEMVSGAPPFDGDIHAVFTQHQERPPPPLRDISPPLATLIAAMLEKQPDARPGSMAEIDRLLDGIANDPPTLVEDIATVVRPHRSPRNWRVPVAAAAGAALVAGALTFLVLRRGSPAAVPIDAATPVAVAADAAPADATIAVVADAPRTETAIVADAPPADATIAAEAQPSTVRREVHATPPALPVCDADEATQRGNAHVTGGRYVLALSAFEQAYACKPDAALVPKAFMAACRAKQADKAHVWFAKLTGDKQDYYAQICVKEGIDVVRCDANAALARGNAALDANNFATALEAFEAAARCSPDLPQLPTRLYLAACRSRNATKAKLYLAKLPATKRDYLAQLCMKEGIDPR